MVSRDHLSWSEVSANSDYVSYGTFNYGWTVRNLSALQMLDAIREMILVYEEGK